MQDTPVQALEQALRTFAAAPGRHALRQREPGLLFEHLDTLAQWALGRLPVGLDRPTALQDAAVLFVQRACFVPGNNHYQVLGLEPRGLTPEKLRARYRALIRLTHPDMGVRGLPADAAGMVNRAHEVLADPERRNAYDRQLVTQLPPTVSHPRPTVVPQAMPVMAMRNGWHARWTGLCARHPKAVRLWLGGGVLAMLAVLMVGWGAHDSAADRRLVIGGERSRTGQETDAPQIRLRVPVQWESGVEVPVAVLRDPAQASAAMSNTPTTLASTAAASGMASPPVAQTKPATDSTHATAIGETSLRTGTAPRHVTATTRATTTVLPVRTEPSPRPDTAFASNTIQPMNQAGPLLPTASPATTDSPSASAGSAPSVATSQAQATQRSAASENSGPRAGSSSDAEPVWEVDTTRARHYLVELLNELEEPSRALKTSRYLAHMNVRGSLLQPQLQGSAPAQALRLERVYLNESRQAGLLRIRGVLQVQLDGPGAGSRATKLRLSAEFRGTAEGTVLTQLDMKETD